MSDPNPSTVPPNPSATQEPQGDPADLGEKGKKALTAERDARAAAEAKVKELQAKIDAAEAAKLSDIDKAKKDAADARAEAESARAESLRWRIAAKHGVSDEDAELFLTGSDEETLTKQAQRLAERTSNTLAGGNVAKSEGSTPSRPAEDEERDFARNLFGRALAD